jgi:hypothetical protein
MSVGSGILYRVDEAGVLTYTVPLELRRAVVVFRFADLNPEFGVPFLVRIDISL